MTARFVKSGGRGLRGGKLGFDNLCCLPAAAGGPRPNPEPGLLGGASPLPGLSLLLPPPKDPSKTGDRFSERSLSPELASSFGCLRWNWLKSGGVTLKGWRLFPGAGLWFALGLYGGRLYGGGTAGAL